MERVVERVGGLSEWVSACANVETALPAVCVWRAQVCGRGRWRQRDGGE